MLRRLWWKLRGIIWMRKDGKTSYTLYRSGWMVVSDGVSKDALPISLCSQELIRQIEADLAAVAVK